MVANPRKGEKWKHIQHGTICRVMAESIEGYVVARNKGSMPFLVHINEWHKRFSRMTGTEQRVCQDK